MAGNRGVKAAGQAGVRGGQALQIRPRDPKHNSLIGIGVGGNAGLMQLQRAAEHPVTGAHAVELVLDDIFHPAAQQQIDLIEVMVVQLDLVHVGRPVAVDLIVGRDHRLAFGVGVVV